MLILSSWDYKIPVPSPIVQSTVKLFLHLLQKPPPTYEVDKGLPFHGRCMAKKKIYISLDERKQINMDTTIAIPVR